MLSTIAERKKLILQWTRVEGRSLVAISEKSKKKMVRGFMSKGGVIWLAGLLKSFEEKPLVMQEEEVIEEKRWRDHQCMVLAAAQVNPNGYFIKVNVTPLSSKGRRVVFCIPAGRNGGGWRAVGEVMAKFVGVLVRDRSSRPATRVMNNLSFAEALNWVSRLEDGEASEKKKITLSCSFIGDDSGWNKMSAYLVVAKDWLESCAFLSERSNFRREDENSVFQVRLGDPIKGMEVPERIETGVAAAATSGKELSKKIDELLEAIQILNDRELCVVDIDPR